MNICKGPNSLGNKNANRISPKYRDVHPSYIGKIDINVCGNSDPGTTGVLTPFCKTHGLHFEDVLEPEEFKYEFEQEIREMEKEQNPDNVFIELDYDKSNIRDLFDKMNHLTKFVQSNTAIIKKEHEEDNDMLYINISLDGEDEI